jgi:acetyl esterase/lipase
MKFRLFIILLAVCCIFAACGTTPAPADEGTSAIIFNRPLGTKLELEIFPPEAPDTATGAAVLVFHGGSWVTGSKEQLPGEFPQLFDALHAQGITIVTADYRLATDGRDWSDCLADCVSAYHYLRRNAKKLGLDADRIGVMGYSAGAHLAMMAAVTEEGIPLCISLSGPTVLSFSPSGEYSSDALLYYRDLAFGEQDFTAGSPKAQLGRRCETSFLLVNGKADPVIPYAHAEAFGGEAAALKVDAELMLAEGLTHSYNAYPDIAALSEEIAEWITEKYKNN